MKIKKVLVFIMAGFVLVACNQNEQKIKDLENQIQVLSEKVSSTYSPGYGEIMGMVQVHHKKLWFAGKTQNWELAKFEIHELKEGLENIEKYQKDRPENEHISMIYPILDSVENSLHGNSSAAFENSYQSLTNTCNSCHKLTHYEYIQICTPELPLNGNQIFKKK